LQKGFFSLIIIVGLIFLSLPLFAQESNSSIIEEGYRTGKVYHILFDDPFANPLPIPLDTEGNIIHYKGGLSRIQTGNGSINEFPDSNNLLRFVDILGTGEADYA
jgi:hypothetical protein